MLRWQSTSASREWWRWQVPQAIKSNSHIFRSIESTDWSAPVPSGPNATAWPLVPLSTTVMVDVCFICANNKFSLAVSTASVSLGSIWSMSQPLLLEKRCPVNQACSYKNDFLNISGLCQSCLPAQPTTSFSQLCLHLQWGEQWIKRGIAPQEDITHS
jgi:hypothetical protein